jgi:murein L,D-transpeptidase YcbB/YkuD
MKLTFGILLAGLWIAMGLSFSGCGKGRSAYIDTVATPITLAVNKIKISQEYYQKKVELKTGVFYNAHQFKKAWLGKNRPNKEYKAYVEEVKQSLNYGMDPSDYAIAELEKAVEALYDNRKRTDEDISNLDIRITASFFLYTTHLIEGRIRYPGAREFIWKKGMPLDNDIALLLTIESAKDVSKEIEKLQPEDPQYTLLQEALEEYRKLEPADTLQSIPGRVKVSPGESHEQIPLVRKKINLLSNRRNADSDTSTIYDNKLVNDVKEFQTLHGLKTDGLLEAKTIRYLNMPVREKAELISLNLERLRWHPHTTADNNEVVVNVPEFMLRIYNNKKTKLEMRVVTGTEFNATPVFHDTLKYIVFSPTWSVPKSIIEEEFLPKLKENSAHFGTERFRFYKEGQEIDPTLEDWTDDSVDVKAYKVVENPGPDNSLGRVKFIMPNDFSIYLHDTPANKLFALEERALSHGCVRVEKPVDFASYLLQDQPEWTTKKIEEAMEKGEPVQVNLNKPFPVYIVYRTVWVDEKNRVNFREDIYGHDQRQLARLQ